MNAKTMDKVLRIKRKIEVLAADLRSEEPLISLHISDAAQDLDLALEQSDFEKKR